MKQIKLPVEIELTPHQIVALLKGELKEGQVSSASNPDGIFYNLAEKYRIINYFENQ